MKPTETFVTTRDIATHFGVCMRTVDRWENSPKLGFPKPVVINRRRYFRLAEIQAWQNRMEVQPSETEAA